MTAKAGMPDDDRSSGLPYYARALTRFFRRLDEPGPAEPLPPPLPDARIVPVSGRGEIFVRDTGAAAGQPTVMLLHGWTLSADLNWFAGGYEVAAHHGRMLAPDIRGHGRGLRSERPFTLEAAADDVAALIEALDAGPAVLVGYSMGGSIALLCAARHRQLVRALVLVSTGLQWRADLWERVTWLGMGAAEYGLRFGTPKGITERYLRYSVEHPPGLEPYLPWVKAEARRGDPAEIGHAAKALARFDARRLARGLDVPAAVVVTCRDRLIRSKRQEDLARALPHAQAIHIEGAHNAWLIRPLAFNDGIDEGLGLVLGTLPAPARTTANGQVDDSFAPRDGRVAPAR